jgi:lactoylglutathione lyase
MSTNIIPKFTWQQTMLRIKDPSKSIPFYIDNFGFKLIHQYHFDKWGFSLYFLATVPENTILAEPGSVESANYLWSLEGTCLELTHNHGSETDDNFKVYNVFHQFFLIKMST